MSWLKRLVLAAGVATLVYLLWHFDPRLVWAEVAGFGWAFAVVIPFQLFDHALNALGWRFAFRPEDAPRMPLWRLIYVRVAGDGVNYLTPSANIGGEFVRPAMLGPGASLEARITSVVLAKFTQALGQAAFIVSGMLLLVHGKLDFLGPAQKTAALTFTSLTAASVLFAIWVLTRPNPLGERIWRLAARLGNVREPLRRFVADHPWRLVLSGFFFALGYAWGAFEVWLICRFMGVPMDLRTAFAVEVLSNVIDSAMFMVPAKVGTQEAGKTAIFAGLGLPARQGLAFGLIRHVRELVWAAMGLGLYALHRRRPEQEPPGTPLPPAEPA